LPFQLYYFAIVVLFFGKQTGTTGGEIRQFNEFIFQKIGYSAIVIAAIELLFITSQHIIKQDKLRIKIEQSETTLK